MSEILALGVSHRTAPLELRERLALTEGRATGVLSEFVASDPVLEAAALSTCNRTEVYLVASNAVEAESAALGMLAREAGIRLTELLGRIYSLRDSQAASHLFSVTAGLDSMILGEAEIQGQVKRAYELSLVEGATGPILNRLFRGAIAAGKRARSETRIGEGRVSVSSAAVELAQSTLGDLARRAVLLIGAGETAELTAKALSKRGAGAVFIANRHYDRAIGLAERFGGKAVRFEELPAQLAEADIVVSSTNSPHHIVEREELDVVMSERRDRRLLMLDLAVPRDVDPAAREVEGVTVHDVDGVQELADRHAAGREAEIERARSVLASELTRFETWLASLEVLPTIAALRERGDAIADQVLAENAPRWESLSEADRDRLRSMARAIASRLLHEPTLKMRKSAGSEDAYLFISALRELFALDATTEPEGESADVRELRSRGERDSA